MLNLADAKKKAKKYLANIDHCAEYDNAYVFSNKNSMLSFGGDNDPVVVLKDTGKVVNMTYYIDNLAGKMIKEQDL